MLRTIYFVASKYKLCVSSIIFALSLSFPFVVLLVDNDVWSSGPSDSDALVRLKAFGAYAYAHFTHLSSSTTATAAGTTTTTTATTSRPSQHKRSKQAEVLSQQLEVFCEDHSLNYMTMGYVVISTFISSFYLFEHSYPLLRY